MVASRGRRIAYWVTTLMVLLPTAGTAIPELFGHGPAATVQSLHALGYPLYLMKINGVMKILGAMTVLLNRPARLVEWAYAGFSFLLLGAAASHLLAGDAPHAPIPFSLFVLLMASYALHRQVRGVSKS